MSVKHFMLKEIEDCHILLNSNEYQWGDKLLEYINGIMRLSVHDLGLIPVDDHSNQIDSLKTRISNRFSHLMAELNRLQDNIIEERNSMSKQKLLNITMAHMIDGSAAFRLENGSASNICVHLDNPEVINPPYKTYELSVKQTQELDEFLRDYLKELERDIALETMKQKINACQHQSDGYAYPVGTHIGFKLPELPRTPYNFKCAKCGNFYRSGEEHR